MTSNNLFKSDLYKLHNYIQGSFIVYPKELVISTLKDFFSKDSYYHFAKDQWGFSNTTDHTNLPLGADIPINPANLSEIVSTRVFIGENYRQDGIFYPAILIKHNGGKSVPISMNREQGSIQYEGVIYTDGYNNITIFRPASFITAGAFEGSITVDIMTKSLRSRDDLAELVFHCFTEVYFDEIFRAGMIIKPISVSGTSESDDRNDKLFKLSLTLDFRVEWRREIPISTFIESILFSIEFADLVTPDSIPNYNLTINTKIT